MADTEFKFALSEDTAARQKLLKGLSEVEAAQKKLAIALAKGELSNDDYAKSFAKLSKEASTLKRALSPLDKEFKDQEKAALAAEKAILAQSKAMEEAAQKADTLDGRLASLDERLGVASSQFGASGDIASGVSTVGGAVSAIPGLSGVSGAASGVAGIFDLTEQLPRLKVAFEGLPTVAAKAADTIGLGGVTGALQNAIPGLTAGAAGIGSLALAAAPLVAALGAIAIGMAITEANTKKAVAAQEAQNQLLLAEAETRRAAQDFLAEGDTQGLVDTRQEVQGTVFDLTDSIEVLQQSIAEQNAKIEEESTRWNASLIVPGLRAARKTTEDELAALVAARNTEIARLAELDTALQGVSEEEINRALNSENLAIIEQDLAATEQERTQAANQLEQAQSRVAQLDLQRSQAIEQFAANETRITEDRTIAETRQLEDRTLRYQEHVANLEQIESDGNQRIVALRSELASLPAERQAALTKIESDGTKKLAAINADYMKKATADAKAFSLSQQRTAKDTQTAIARLAEDNAKRLSEAESSNNVIEFLKASAEGATALKRASEDAKTEQERAAQDFAAKQAEQAEIQQQRIAEAIAGIAAEKQAAIDGFNEKQAALQQSIEAEKLAISERTAAAEASYQKELERQALADARKAEDQAREDARRLEAHNAQLAQIDERKQKELEAVNAIGAVLTTIGQKAAALQAQAQQIATQSAVKAAQANNSGSSSYTIGSNSFTFGGNKIKAFANEGVATRPTLAMVGDKPGYSEAMINFRQSEGLPASLAKRGLSGGGNNINITAPVNVTVGDIASASMVRQEVQTGVETVLYNAIAPLLEKALAGVTT